LIVGELNVKLELRYCNFEPNDWVASTYRPVLIKIKCENNNLDSKVNGLK